MKMLEQRVLDLEAQTHIRTLKAAYMEGCDFHIGAAMGDLFAPDGIWEGVGRFAMPKGPLVGRDAVAREFASDDGRLTFCAHYLTNEAIKVDGDTATGTWMFLEPATSSVHGQVWMAGRYRDDFVAIDGRWYIKHLRCKDIFVAPYATGWEGAAFLDLGWGSQPGEQSDAVPTSGSGIAIQI